MPQSENETPGIPTWLFAIMIIVVPALLVATHLGISYLLFLVAGHEISAAYFWIAPFVMAVTFFITNLAMQANQRDRNANSHN